MRILVTGGAGFIGSHLVEQLVKDGHDVLVLDNLQTGKLENLREFLDVTSPLHFRNGDIRSYDTCHRAMQGVESVFHLAALGSVPRSMTDPFATNSVNVAGTLNVLHAAWRAGTVKSFVNASSSSVYGKSGYFPAHDEGATKCEDDPKLPQSPYGVSKLAAEQYCHMWRLMHGLPTTSLRFFNVFGARQNPDGPYAAVIPRFIRSCLRGEPLTVYGDGTQTRDFTHVENVVEACVAAAERAPAGAYNVGCGRSVSVNELARLVAEACDKPLGHSATIEHVEARKGDVHASEASITRAWDDLGYRPRVHLFDGLKRTVKWFKTQEGR